mgnify:CR=1 FL=1
MLRQRFQILLIVFITLGIYYPSIFSEFNSLDDEDMINHLMELESIDLKGLFFPESGLQYYRPVLYLTFVLDRFLWLCEPSFMHLENLLMHLINTLLVFFITKRLIEFHSLKASAYTALVASILFSIHPLSTEPVNWVSGRTDLMAGLFVFSSFLALLKGIDKKEGDKVSAVWITVSALFYLLGLLSKESAIGLLPATGLYLLLKGDRLASVKKRDKINIFLLYLVVTAFYFLLRHLATGGSDSGLSKAGSAITSDVLIKLRGIMVATGFYMKKLFVPLPLNFAIVEVKRIPYLILGILSFIGFMVIIKKRGLSGYLLLFSFSFIIPALPVAVGKMTWTPLAERYLYISTAGAVIFSVIILERYIAKRWITHLIIAVLLIFSGLVTARRNILWQDNLSLYEDTIKKSPDFAAIRNEYAIALSRASRVEEGLKQFSIASDLSKGSSWQPELNLLESKFMVNKSAGEKKKAYISKLDDPKMPRSIILKRIVNLIEAEMMKEKDQGRIEELVKEEITYLNMLKEIEKDGSYYYRLGQLYLIKKEKEKALDCFKQAVVLSPDRYFSSAARKLVNKLESE